jgi:hypothetical protein
VSDDDRAPPARNANGPTALNSADPIRNFGLTVDERIRALTIGVPAWAARKRKIEDDEARFVSTLVELHDKLAAKNRPAEAIASALREAAQAIDLVKLNELVKAHNRYYPVEANLPMDRQTGAYLIYGRVWHPEPAYTAELLLARAHAAIDRRNVAD